MDWPQLFSQSAGLLVQAAAWTLLTRFICRALRGVAS